MVRNLAFNVTAGRNGLRDWIWQRGSALVLLVYVLFLVGRLLLNPIDDHAEWQALFAHNGMRVFTLLALLAVAVHAWVGMWTVGTDYLTARMMGRGATVIRFFYELFCVSLLFAYVAWGIQILWSI